MRLVSLLFAGLLLAAAIVVSPSASVPTEPVLLTPTPEPCHVRSSWEFSPGVHVAIIVAGSGALPPSPTRTRMPTLAPGLAMDITEPLTDTATPTATPAITATVMPTVTATITPTATPTSTRTPRPTSTTPYTDRVWLAFTSPPTDLYVAGGLRGTISLDHPFVISYAPPSRAQSTAPFTIYSCPPRARPNRVMLSQIGR